MLLEVRNLRVTYRTQRALVHAVDGMDLLIDTDENFGLVGESGCGKSTLVKALLRLVPPTALVEADVLRFKEHDLLSLSDARFRRDILMREIALVPQSA
ncbi:MAG: ATP-binding cassette domain-containing protein [Burkholderiaceae bacterium]|nr:ATP-binding cassette domain-containing protein [Burkholderiaceae bacterium]